MGGDLGAELAAVDIHDVLSNERRRMVLSILRDVDGSATARELSERIAEMETGQTPAPRNIRQSAYVSLHQTHLPKLDSLDIVDYDDSAKTVRLSDRANRVNVYMETVPRYGISWSEYYVAVSVVGLLLVVASAVGVPVVSTAGTAAWAVLTLIVVSVSAVYQTRQQGSSIVHRLGQDGERDRPGSGDDA